MNFKKFNSKELSEIRNLLRKLLENNYLIIEETAKNTLEDIYNKKSRFIKIAFFRELLLPEDFNALEASVYIQSLFEEGKEIRNFKKDLIIKYGERGNTICKIYSAGYFESLIMPLCIQMKSEETFSLERFRLVFDKLLREFPLAVFVNQHMNTKDILEKVEIKIAKNRKYGIHQLNIHGIGKTNCNNISKALEIIIKDKSLKIKERLEKENIILVIIELS
ncbi:MAG: hypothetical protein ABH821_01795 [archaeon]